MTDSDQEIWEDPLGAVKLIPGDKGEQPQSLHTGEVGTDLCLSSATGPSLSLPPPYSQGLRSEGTFHLPATPTHFSLRLEGTTVLSSSP